MSSASLSSCDLLEHTGAVACMGALNDYLTKVGRTVVSVFRMFDRSGDGSLDLEELHDALMCRLKLPGITESDVQDFIAFLDGSQDGVIDLDELSGAVKLYRRSLKSGKLAQWAGLESDEDMVFPSWLVRRRDFRLFFPRLRELYPTKSTNFSRQELLLFSMSVDQEARTHEDLTRLAEWMGEVHLFRSLPFDARFELATKLLVGKYDKGTTLFHQGDLGDAVYIVVAGKVSLWKKLPDGTKRMLVTLGDGIAFGEMALEKADGLRDATVRIVKASTLASIKSFSYKAVIDRFNERRTARRISFLLHSLPLTRNWSFSRARETAALLRDEGVRKGDVIVVEGGPISDFMILCRGSAVVYTYFTVTLDHFVPIENGGKRKLSVPRRIKHVIENVEAPAFIGEASIFREETNPYYASITSESADLYCVRGEVALSFFTATEIESIRKASLTRSKPGGILLEDYFRRRRLKSLCRALQKDAMGPVYQGRIEEDEKRSHAAKSNRTVSVPSLRRPIKPMKRWKPTPKEPQPCQSVAHSLSTSTLTPPTVFQESRFPKMTSIAISAVRERHNGVLCWPREASLDRWRPDSATVGPHSKT